MTHICVDAVTRAAADFGYANVASAEELIAGL
jgi:hypothetical protein